MMKRIRNGIRDNILKSISLDSRSLALFRVTISSLFLIDFLFTRLPYFTLFFTEKGISSIYHISKNHHTSLQQFSLNFLSTNVIYQYTLFFITIAFLLCLLIGYKTKWSALGSYILIASFFSKSPLIYNSGDIISYLMLFWALALPLNHHFSIDSALQKNQKVASNIYSINSFALMAQILLIYFFTYLLKKSELWDNNESVYYALMLHNFRTQFGDVLLQYPNVMKWLSYLTYQIIEKYILFAFFLFGFWGKARLFLIIVMCGFHLGLNLFLHLGLFSWFMIAGWLLFLPPEFWNTLQKIFLKNKLPLTVYYDGACSFCEKSSRLLKTFLILSKVSFVQAQTQPVALKSMKKNNSWIILDSQKGVISGWKVFTYLSTYSPFIFYLSPLLRLQIISYIGGFLYKMISKNRNRLNQLLPSISQPTKNQNPIIQSLISAFFLFCFLYVICWNVRTLNFKKYEKYFSTQWNPFGQFFHLGQKWNMFSPPYPQSQWVVLFGVIKNPDQSEIKVNLWRPNQPLSTHQPPKRYDQTFPIFRIRKMMENLAHSGNNLDYPIAYLRYLCRLHNKNRNHKKFEWIEMVFMEVNTPPYGQKPAPAKQKSSYKQICSYV